VGGRLSGGEDASSCQGPKATRAYKVDLGRKWREASSARGFARFLAFPPRGSLLVSFWLRLAQAGEKFDKFEGLVGSTPKPSRRASFNVAGVAANSAAVA
jgi:hypothetical protein